MTLSSRGLAALATMLAVLSAPASGGTRAQPAPAERALPGSVFLSEHACEPAAYEPESFFRLLRLELASLHVQLARLPEGEPSVAARAASEAVAIVGIECGGEPETLALRVTDFASQKQLARVLSLADVPADARPRTLALALCALLESSWTEIAAAAPAAAPSASELPEPVQAALRARLRQRLAPATRSAAPSQSAPAASEPVPATELARSLLHACLTARFYPARSTGLLGLRFGYAPRLGASTRLALEGETLFGQNELDDAQGALGRMDLFGFAASAGIAAHTRAVPELELGPRLQVGYALASAHANRSGIAPHDRSHALVSALVAVDLRAPLAKSQFLQFGADLGYTFVGVVFLGGQTRLAGIAGVTCALRAGLAF